MKTLLQIEWMKVRNYRTFWILAALFVIAVIGINYISFRINTEVNNTTSAVGLGTGNPFDFPQIWNTMAWMSSMLLYFPGFIMIFLISNEFTFKTHRQNIIDGLSRKEFVMIKLNVALIIAIVTTLIVFLVTLLFGLLGGGKFSLEGIEYMGYFFICSFIYILFAMVIALLLRKAALSVGIYFIYGLIIDNVIPALLRKSFDGKPYGSYIMPLDVADGLLPFPFFKNQVDAILKTPNPYICLVICIAWIIFYYSFSIRKFQNEDL
ncbi:MAG: ABC transporter permease [Chitinophagaceae bacterium]